jgi:hypothetical protein
MSSPAEVVANFLSDADAIRVLESHVDSQLSGAASYDFAANRYLLKLYSCFPESASAGHIASVLVLSMMRLPAKDLLAVASLLPSGQDADARVQAVLDATRALEGGQFRRFWEVVASASTVNVFSAATGFDAALRSFVLGAVCDTFRSLPAGDLQGMLGLGDHAALAEYCQQNKHRVASVSSTAIVAM